MLICVSCRGIQSLGTVGSPVSTHSARSIRSARSARSAGSARPPFPRSLAAQLTRQPLRYICGFDPACSVSNGFVHVFLARTNESPIHPRACCSTIWPYVTGSQLWTHLPTPRSLRSGDAAELQNHATGSHPTKNNHSVMRAQCISLAGWARGRHAPACPSGPCITTSSQHIRIRVALLLGPRGISRPSKGS